jgi:hypothetical protein
MFKNTVISICLVSLGGCNTVPTADQAAALDIGTTAVVLSTRGGVELNPMGFWGTSLVKLVYLKGVIFEKVSGK